MSGDIVATAPAFSQMSGLGVARFAMKGFVLLFLYIPVFLGLQFVLGGNPELKRSSLAIFSLKR